MNSLRIDDNKKKAIQVIQLWDGEDYFALMTELSKKLEVNLFEEHHRRMRLITGKSFRNKHTGEQAMLLQIEKHVATSYDGDDIDGPWYYTIDLEGGRTDSFQGKTFWEHWEPVEDDKEQSNA